ncbi:ribosomal protein L4 domain-containing protein [Peziza echinospora]|nr:ribosomal protein L4 domain-containing protein [Peziza echinospora]
MGAWDVTRDMILHKEEYKSRKGKISTIYVVEKYGPKLARIRHSGNSGWNIHTNTFNSGRAVARIPRVSGGGTHRAGQAAFGNMCRSGRMFAPTKIWRKWHVKVPQNQRRFATSSAVAASGVPALVLARGHRIEKIPEFPLVLSTSTLATPIAKTREAVALLKSLGAFPDVLKVTKSKKLRAGKGKLRSRRHRQRRGPLIVFNPESPESAALVKAFRNVPGVETSSVKSLNLLQLAPGGHLGRFVIWTDSAFKALNDIYGSATTPSLLKKNYLLPSNIVTNADIGRIINSSEIQGVVRAAKGGKLQKRGGKAGVLKKNPLKNRQVLLRLNPYAAAYSKEKLGQKKEGANHKDRAYIKGSDFAAIIRAD